MLSTALRPLQSSSQEKEGITMAGKTGTAQVPYRLKNEDGTYMRDEEGKTIRKIQKNCWFASFAPYESPSYAVIVLMEDGNSGGTSAAPLVRQFFDLWSKTAPPVNKIVCNGLGVKRQEQYSLSL